MVTCHIGGSFARAAVICFPRYSRVSCSIELSICRGSAGLGREGDVHRVAIGMDERTEEAAGTLLRVGGGTQLTSRADQLITGQLVYRIPVFGTEWIPQSATLIVGPELSDLDAHHLSRRQHDVHLSSAVIDVYLGSRIEVYPGQDRPGDNHERSFGRAQVAVLVDDNVAHGGLAG